MKRTLVLTSLLLATALARADIVVEQKMESAMMNGNITMKVKGDKARMDMPSPIGGTQTMIFKTGTGDMITLMHAQKMAMKVNYDAIKKQAEAQQKAAGIDPATMAAPKATGTKEKVGEWDAEIYEYQVGPSKGRLWVSKDFPNGKAINDQINVLSAKMAAGGVDPTKLNVPGMVVKPEMTTPGGKFTTTLLKATEQDVPESEFAIPSDYKEMTMPGAPGAPATPAAPAAPVAPVPPAKVR
jgi:hypothetical protein